MRALEPEVVNAVWEAVKHLIPQPVDNHPPRLPPPAGSRPALLLGDSHPVDPRMLLASRGASAGLRRF